MTKKATEAGDPGVERDVRNSWVVHIYLGTIDIVHLLESCRFIVKGTSHRLFNFTSGLLNDLKVCQKYESLNLMSLQNKKILILEFTSPWPCHP